MRSTTSRSTTAAVLTAALTVTACSTVGDTGGDDAPVSDTVVLVTHDSFSVGKEQLADFEEQTGLTVQLRSPGDAGTLVNQLVLTKDSPLGDAVFGIDNAFASRALDAGVLESYAPETTGDLVEGLALEDDDRLTPVDYGDVCVNVDEEWFAARDISAPRTLEDLADPRYEDLLVVTDPATSSPGLAFLLGTIDAYGEDWPAYWERLRDNGLAVADSWEDAYYVDFTAAGDGERPLALSYASSPPYTVPKGEDEPTTSAMLGTCFRQVEYAGVIAGAENPDGAQQLVDFLLSRQVQEQVPTRMYVYPALADAELPPDWQRHAPLAEDPFTVSPADIDANREEWIEQWSATVVG